MGFLSGIIFFTGGFSILIYVIRRFLVIHWNCDWARNGQEENIRGRIVIITGASKGIGNETAIELANRHARVIVTARSLTDAKEALVAIRRKTFFGEVIPMKLDLGNIQSIKEFYHEIIKTFDTIDILINNAGVLIPSDSIERTGDGFEAHFGINHLGHFLLTNLLLPLLKNADNAKIIIVTSGTFRSAQLRFDDLNWEKGLIDHKPKQIGDYPLYKSSKLANVLFAKELAKRLEGTGVRVYTVCPGIVLTSISRQVNTPISYLLSKAPFVLLTIKTAKQGCQTVVYCAVSKECAYESGQIYRNSALWDFNKLYIPDNILMSVSASATKVNDINAARLWEESEKCLQMKFPVL